MKKTSLIIAVLIIALILSSCSLGKTTIDFEKYVSVTIGDYNGYANATLDVDYDAIRDLVDSTKMDDFVKDICEDKGVTSFFAGSEIYSLTDFIDVDFEEEYSNLSNGDKVKVVVVPSSMAEEMGLTLNDISKGLGVSFKHTELEFEASDLPDGKVFDFISLVPDDLLVYYTGSKGSLPVDGFATFDIADIAEEAKKIDEGLYYTIKTDFPGVRIAITYNNESIAEMDLAFSVNDDKHQDELSSGDTITCYVESSDSDFFNDSNIKPVKELFESLGYVFIVNSKEFTVPNLPKIVPYSSDYIDTIKASALKSADAYSKADNHREIVFDSMYLVKVNDSGVIKNHGKENIVVFAETEGLFNRVFVATVGDIVEKEDGTIDVSWDDTWDYGHKISKNGIEEYFEENWEDYTYEKIG